MVLYDFAASVCRISFLSIRCLEAKGANFTWRIAPGPGARLSDGSGRRRRRRRDSGRAHTTIPHHCSHPTGLAGYGRIDRFIAPIFLVKGVVCFNVLPSMASSKDNFLLLLFNPLLPHISQVLAQGLGEFVVHPQRTMDGDMRYTLQKKKQSSSLLLETIRSLAIDKERMEMVRIPRIDIGLAPFGIATMSRHGAHEALLERKTTCQYHTLDKSAFPLW